MARVHDVHGRHGSSAPSATTLHKRAALKQKPSYKVVFEEIGGKQKKLKTLLHGSSKPPEGYTFIPAGDPQLTSRCKQIAKAEGLTIFIVSTSTDPTKPLSRETHRVGYHFPSQIVDKACDSLGVTLTSTGRVVQSHLATLDERNARPTNITRPSTKRKQKSGGRNEVPPLFNINSLSQAEIDTQAREALKDLFPNMPGQDLHDIIGRAFQKGKGLVGTANDVTLVRRAQLAVIAHIRHVYTNYDRLLKIRPWQEARALVEQSTLDKLIQWRGDEDDTNDMDEILREVIVIPDDDDEEEEDQMQENRSSVRERAERDSSVEIITADSLQTQAINYASANRPGDTGRMDSPSSDDVEVIEYRGQPPVYHGQHMHYNQHREDQMDAHRRRRWEEARDRRRNETLYVLDHDSAPANTESFGRVSYHQNKSDHQQPYKSEPRHQMTEAPGFPNPQAPVYTPLLPLPRGTESSYNVQPQGVEREARQSLSNQVVYPTEQHRLFTTRRPVESGHVYHAKEPHPYSENPYPLDIQRPSKKLFNETTSVIRPHDPFPDHDNMLYVSSQHLERRQSDIILPSIEDDSLVAQKQRTIDDAYPHQISRFALGDTTNNSVPRKAVPFEYRHDIHEGSPHTKKRRINDRQPLNTHDRSWDADIPLDKRDNPQGVGQRHSNITHDYDIRPSLPRHDNVLPFSPDRRIVQLPFRDVIGYQGSQTHLPMNLPVPSENQPIRRVSKEHFQVPLPNVGASQQPQSLSRSAFSQPVYFHDSPTLLSASRTAPAYRGVIDSSPASRRTSGMVVDDEQNFPGAFTVIEYPRRLESPAKEIRNPFRYLAIDDRQRTEYKPSMKENQGLERVNYKPAENTYASIRPHHDAHASGLEGGQRPRLPNIENSGQYGQRIVEAPKRNPFTRDRIQSLPTPTQDQWNQQADSSSQPSRFYAETQVPVPNARSSHREDTRPRGYSGSRPFEGRGAAEVIVLE